MSDIVGNFVGSFVGDFVGDFVGGFVGDLVGNFVGDLVGDFVGILSFGGKVLDLFFLIMVIYEILLFHVQSDEWTKRGLFAIPWPSKEKRQKTQKSTTSYICRGVEPANQRLSR